MSARSELLDDLTSHIRSGQPISFCKDGDGEQAAMANAVGENCDGSRYSPELGRKLRAAFSFFDSIPEVRVVYFCNQEEYQVLLHAPPDPATGDIQQTVNFWRAVRASNHRKVFVGPERLAPVVPLLRCDAHVIVPLGNAFDSYDDILRRMIVESLPGAIFIFSSGMTAKPLAADIIRHLGGDVSCMDSGSAWDAMFFTSTRDGALLPEVARGLYADLLRVHSIVCTKNRALQLDALLKSMKVYAPQFWPPTLFWMATNDDDARAYQALFADYPECPLVDQARATFSGDLLSKCLATDADYAALFCDDDVFFRPAPFCAPHPGTAFSLRFGEGVGDGCSPEFVAAACAALPPVAPGTAPAPPGPGPELRGYSMDGNVHPINELRAAIASLGYFPDPSNLEARLNTECKPIQELHGAQNCMLSIPHNLVQDVFPNNPNMGFSPADLTRRYLAGERIDLDAMDFSNVIDAHQFLPYVFKRV